MIIIYIISCYYINFIYFIVIISNTHIILYYYINFIYYLNNPALLQVLPASVIVAGFSGLRGVCHSLVDVHTHSPRLHSDRPACARLCMHIAGRMTRAVRMEKILLMSI